MQLKLQEGSPKCSRTTRLSLAPGSTDNHSIQPGQRLLSAGTDEPTDVSACLTSRPAITPNWCEIGPDFYHGQMQLHYSSKDVVPSSSAMSSSEDYERSESNVGCLYLSGHALMDKLG